MSERESLQALVDALPPGEARRLVLLLVSRLAHAVGTPLGVILGHADLLEAAVLDPRDRERLQIVRDQVDRVSQTIQALLASVNGGSSPPARVALQPRIAGTVEGVAGDSRARGLRVETDLVASAAAALGGERLPSLLAEILINAARILPAGSSLHVVTRDLGPGRVEVCIRDAGAGGAVAPGLQFRMVLATDETDVT